MATQVTTKIPFYGRTKTPRTRLGCLCCRERKLKCDEQKPNCQRCVKSKRSCTYFHKLTLPGETRESLQKQASHGNSNDLSECLGDNQHTLQDQEIWSAFLNTTIDDFESKARSFCSHKHEKLANSPKNGVRLDLTRSCPPLAVSIYSPPVQLSKYNMALLDFYAHGMCQDCNLVSKLGTSYRNIIIPQSIRLPLVLGAVLAVAANSLSNTSSTTSLQHKDIALRYLNHSLTSLAALLSSPTSALSSSKAEILCTILMLCLFDISTDWSVHLDGASRIISLPVNNSHCGESRDIEAVTGFLAQYFSAHCVLAYTALSDPTSGQRLLEAGRFWLGLIQCPRQEIDCFTGARNELMDIILEIGHEIREGKKGKAREDLQAWRLEMEERLEGLIQDTSPSPKATTPALHKSIETIISPPASAEAFRHAALILLQYLNPNNPQTQSKLNIHTTAILNLRPTWVQHSKTNWRAHSLWPYFIASCHVTTDEERMSVLKLFNDMEVCENSVEKVRRAREVVECVWRRRDLYGLGTVWSANKILVLSGKMSLLWVDATLLDLSFVYQV